MEIHNLSALSGSLNQNTYRDYYMTIFVSYQPENPVSARDSRISTKAEGPRADARKVQVGKDQEKAQSEKDSHSKNRGGKSQTNKQVLIP